MVVPAALLAPVVLKEIAETRRHHRENPKPPRDHSLFKRILLVIGLGIVFVVGGNALIASQGGIFGIAFHGLFGGNSSLPAIDVKSLSPTKTVETVTVPDVARVTQAIRKLGNIEGTRHNFPIQFTKKSQLTFLGINSGSSDRTFDGVGVAVSGSSLRNAYATRTGDLVLPTPGTRGRINIVITLATPKVTDKYFADSNPGEKHGYWGPNISYSEIKIIAQGMLDQAIVADPTLLSEAREDISSMLGPIVVSALDAGQYDATVSFVFADPSELSKFR